MKNRYLCSNKKRDSKGCWEGLMTISNRAKAREFIRVFTTDKVMARVIDKKHGEVIYTSEV